VQLLLKNCSKWPSSGRQLSVNQRQKANPACSVSAAAGEQQQMTTPINAIDADWSPLLCHLEK